MDISGDTIHVSVYNLKCAFNCFVFCFWVFRNDNKIYNSISFDVRASRDLLTWPTHRTRSRRSDERVWAFQMTSSSYTKWTNQTLWHRICGKRGLISSWNERRAYLLNSISYIYSVNWQVTQHIRRRVFKFTSQKLCMDSSSYRQTTMFSWSVPTQTV